MLSTLASINFTNKTEGKTELTWFGQTEAIHSFGQIVNANVLWWTAILEKFLKL